MLKNNISTENLTKLTLTIEHCIKFLKFWFNVQNIILKT